MTSIVAVDLSNAHFFQKLLPAQQQPVLLSMAPGTMAFGASEAGQPVGVAVAVVRPGGALADLVALYVAPEARERGVGSRLLTELEVSLQAVNCQRLIVECLLEKQQEERVERFLQRHGFPASEVALHLFSGDIRSIGELRWYQASRLPEDFAIFPWRELRAEERVEIEHGQGVWYPALLSPFQEEERADVEHSVGLRFRGAVVGWLIVQRLARNMLLYKTMFVKQEFQRTGRGIALAIEMVRQMRLPETVPYGTLLIERGNEAMLQIVRRRFAPLVQREKVLRRTNKAL